MAWKRQIHAKQQKCALHQKCHSRSTLGSENTSTVLQNDPVREFLFLHIPIKTLASELIPYSVIFYFSRAEYFGVIRAEPESDINAEYENT